MRKIRAFAHEIGRDTESNKIVHVTGIYRRLLPKRLDIVKKNALKYENHNHSKNVIISRNSEDMLFFFREFFPMENKPNTFLTQQTSTTNHEYSLRTAQGYGRKVTLTVESADPMQVAESDMRFLSPLFGEMIQF